MAGPFDDLIPQQGDQTSPDSSQPQASPSATPSPPDQPQQAQAGMFDDLIPKQQDQQQPKDQQAQTGLFDDLIPQDKPNSSFTGATVRGFTEGVLPTAASVPFIAPGVATGAEIGGLVGGLPGAAVGGAVGGLAAVFGAGYYASKAQDWVLDKLGLRDGTGWFSHAQQQADIEQHPYASTLGSVAAGGVAFGAGGLGTAASAAERLAFRKAALKSAGIFASLEAAQEAYNEGTIDPGRVAIAAGGGYLMPGAKPWAEGVMKRTGEAVTPTITRAGQALDPYAKPYRDAAAPYVNAAWEKTSAAAQDYYNRTYDAANQAIGKVKDWTVAGRPDLKESVLSDVEKESVQNGDRTMVSQGQAQENTGVNENVPGVGNGEKSAMTRDGRPNYVKVTTPKGNYNVGTGQVHEDVAAALRGANENVVPADQAPLGQQPTAEAIQQAAQLQGSQLHEQVLAMAKQGKSANEIASFTGVPANVVRELRDHLPPTKGAARTGGPTPPTPAAPPREPVQRNPQTPDQAGHPLDEDRPFGKHFDNYTPEEKETYSQFGVTPEGDVHDMEHAGEPGKPLTEDDLRRHWLDNEMINDRRVQEEMEAHDRHSGMDDLHRTQQPGPGEDVPSDKFDPEGKYVEKHRKEYDVLAARIKMLSDAGQLNDASIEALKRAHHPIIPPEDVDALVGMWHEHLATMQGRKPAPGARAQARGLRVVEGGIPTLARAEEVAPGDRYRHPSYDTMVDHTRSTPEGLTQMSPDGKVVYVDKSVPKSIDIKDADGHIRKMNPAVPLTMREIVAREVHDNIQAMVKAGRAKKADPEELAKATREAGNQAMYEWLSHNKYDLGTTMQAFKAMNDAKGGGPPVSPGGGGRSKPNLQAVKGPEDLAKVQTQLKGVELDAFRALIAAGKKAEAEAFLNMPADERAQAAMRGTAVERGVEKPQQEYKNVRRRKVLYNDLGKKVGDLTEQKRTNEAIAAAKSVFEKYKKAGLPTTPGDTSKEAQAKLKEWGKQVTADAVKAGGGKHPNDTYPMQVKEGPFLFLQAARSLNTRDGARPYKLREFYSNMKQLFEGGKEGVENVRDTRKIQGKISNEKRASTDEAIAGGQEGMVEKGREDFDMLPDWKPGSDESKPYIDASNELRKWINTLSPEDYAKLESMHPDLGHDVTMAQDPAWVLDKYQVDLENWKPQGEPVTTKDAPKVGPAPPRKTVGPVKNEWRPVDKNSPEYKKAAEDALARMNERAPVTKGSSKDIPITGNINRPSAEESAEETLARYGSGSNKGKSVGEAVNELAAEQAGTSGKKAKYMSSQEILDDAVDFTGQTKTIDGTLYEKVVNPDTKKVGWTEWDDTDRAGSRSAVSEEDARNLGLDRKGIWEDESGSVIIPEALSRQPSDRYSAATLRTKEAKEAAAISDDLHTMDQVDVNTELAHKKTWEADAKVNKDMHDAQVQKDISKARERGKIDELPEKQQKWYHDFLEPIFKRNEWLYEMIKKFDPSLTEALNPNHVARNMVGKSAIDARQGTDPVSGAKRSLYTVVGPLMDRVFKAIESTDGKRFVISQPPEGGMTVWENGKALHVPAEDFGFKTGEDVKIGNKQYTVKDAYMDEIEQHARGEQGEKIQYYQNAALSAMVANVKLESALRHLIYLDKLMKSQEWAANATRVKPNLSDPLKGDWTQSVLPQLEGWYMNPEYAHVFDDYAQPGFAGNQGLDHLRNLSRAITKMMFWLPSPHILNVGGHWFVAREWKWLTPKGYTDLAHTGIDAIKSVVNQDQFQDDMRKAGAGTLSGGIITQDFAQKVAKEFGIQMMREPGKWQSVVDALGMNKVQDLVDAIYQGSSRVMWAANDMFLTQMVKEHMANGMSMPEAIVHAERHIPNYRVPTVVFGSRNLSRFMQDPLFSAFGRYRYGVFNSYAHIVKGLVNGSAAQRWEAIGNLMAMGMLGLLIYPVLNKWAQFVTGNQYAEQRPRGPLAIPAHLLKAAMGKEDYGEGLKSTVTVPPMVSTAWELAHNTSWSGHPIVQPGALTGPKDLGRRVVQAGEYAARGFISPIGSAENAWGRKQALGQSLRDMLIDVKNPSERAVAFQRKEARRYGQQANRRFLKPQGAAESLYNKLIGR